MIYNFKSRKMFFILYSKPLIKCQKTKSHNSLKHPYLSDTIKELPYGL